MIDAITTNGDSGFRTLFEQCLNTLRGRQIEWPQMMRAMLNAEFHRVCSLDACYKGKHVFIDRDAKAKQYERHARLDREKLQVYRLFRLTHARSNGMLKVGNQYVWLVSCEVPNQGKRSGRRADLLGVREDGSLVVFECKIVTNRHDSPIKACLEGLDYLAHLVQRENFARLEAGYTRWRDKARRADALSCIPKRCAGLNLVRDARHAVLVLAPADYFNLHRLDALKRPQGWELLSDRMWSRSPMACELDFVVSDFSGEPTDMLPLDDRAAKAE